ncbi:uncharacterized protein LOC136092710 [Hydra vulgaris]|uniref:uncharacterized protein LOC136092710 n=1 Tax=Hydra vulgaris TaxID=6087 RepID=UPI0032EA8D83
MSDSSSDNEKIKPFMDEIKNWNVVKLKEFLQARSIPLGENPSKKKLLKNVYYANKLKLPLNKTVQEETDEIKSRSLQKLKLKSGVQLPHPFEIGNWVLEKEVLISDKAVKFCYLKGTVVPQTRINDEEYESWVCLNKNGSIFTAECNCVAGYGESCKHIFALLLFVEEHVRLGDNVTCTSVKQKWGTKTQKRKLHEPDIFQNISIKKVKSSLENSNLKLSRFLYDPRPYYLKQSEFTKEDWEAVAEATDGKCAVICLKPNIQSEYFMKKLPLNATKNKVLPPTIEHYVAQIECSYKNESITFKCEKFLRTFSITLSQAELIKEATISQSKSLLWKSYRVGTISSSIAHAVIAKFDVDLKVKNKRAAFNLCAQILCYKNNAISKSIQWGNMFESYARKRYIREMKKTHKNFTCYQTGLIVSIKTPYLTASPDGITSCTCCGLGLLEIKCPWTFRQKKICEYAQSAESFFEKNSCTNTYSLKSSHQYRTQIQHQLFISGYPHADFYVCLASDQNCERIYSDPNYKKNEQKFQKFFTEYVFPELITKKLEKKEIVTTILNDLIKKCINDSNSKQVNEKLTNDIINLDQQKI